jgi:hypothetical protein
MTGFLDVKGCVLMKKIAVVLCLLSLLFILGCGSSTTKVSSSQSTAEKRTCLANQRYFLSSCDIFAAETGDYPTSKYIPAGYMGSYDSSTADWPTEYYGDNVDTNYAPVCPGNGTVTLTYINAFTRPSLDCDIHGSVED